MAMMTELWGEEVINDTPEEFKERIRNLPPSWWERESYLMHEYQVITGHQWTFRDYQSIGITHNI
jgi:hypothetical protein